MAEENFSILYDDEYLRVIFLEQQNDSEELIITFGDMLLEAEGYCFFADQPLRKLKLPAIGFVAKEAHWYQRSSMLAAYKVLMPILGRFSRRILYGGSMGGYAAIKFSKLFAATHVVALCPQWSIDPAEWPGERAGWEGNFRDYMQGMSIKAGDVSGDIYVFADKFDDKDYRHFLKIKNSIEHVNFVNVPFVGHHVTGVFAGTSKLQELFYACVHNDMRGLYLFSRNTRKSFGFYAQTVQDLALDRFPNLFAKRVIAAQSPPGDVRIMPRIVSTLKDNNRAGDAKALVDQCFARLHIGDSSGSILFMCCVMLGEQVVLVGHHGKVLAVDAASMQLIQVDRNYRPWQFPICVNPRTTSHIWTVQQEHNIFIEACVDNRVSLGYGTTRDTMEVELVPCGRGRFYVKNNGRYLCAEPDGKVMLNRPDAQAWEEFHFEVL
ncbi:hypothetical protein D5366_06425 [Neokomagataea tanensis]|uniref:Alpha/beta hydrolase n=1 Tax=Neokomagataea tanensis TaxID=661191 RepID=A0A4Y6V8A0_9PROT|nr:MULTISPECIES: hypothetical protein [Neokomagataea]QDH24910.1 hypothetical protein D5366_06425 [Neokomagataea tanensis]